MHVAIGFSGGKLMFNDLLGFGGRLNRLQYFLCALGLNLLAAVVVFGLLGLPGAHTSAAGLHATPQTRPPSVVLFAFPVMVAYLWFALAFQCKRVRDIGWKPLYVIPGWIAVIVIDRIVAHAYPALAFGHASTPIAGLINIFLAGSLLFWPSDSGGSSSDDRMFETGWAKPEPLAQPSSSPKPATAGPWDALPPAGGFGRRGI